jgi:hypothetical protein
VNHSNAAAAGGVISTADDLATWIKALVGGKVFNADYQRRWFDSLQPEDPSKPKGQRRDADRVDQSDRITRRPADCQYPLGEGARSDLRCVTASISAQASTAPREQFRRHDKINLSTANTQRSREPFAPR